MHHTANVTKLLIAHGENVKAKGDVSNKIMWSLQMENSTLNPTIFNDSFLLKFS